MSTTIRDASLTTLRRRELALYGARQAIQSTYTTHKEQRPSYGWKGTGVTAEVPQRVNGAEVLIGQYNTNCACTPRVTTLGFSRISPAVCGTRGNA